MNTEELLISAGYGTVSDAPQGEVRRVVADSRLVEKGDIFIALKGTRGNGNDYIEEAFSRGALLAVSAEAENRKGVFKVENPRAAFARLSDAFFGHPTKGLSLIGVTGTNGKTTTTRMIADILRQNGHRVGWIGTLGCFCDGKRLSAIPRAGDRLANFTTPDPFELFGMLSAMKEEGAAYVVMEVSSHALALEKVTGLSFKRGVFTNLSPEHLDFHGTMEDYFKAKEKLFDLSEAAVVSEFSPYGRRLEENLSIPWFSVGKENVKDTVYAPWRGVSFSIVSAFAPLRLQVPALGSFAVENAALAAMTALSLGISGKVIEEALSAFHGVKGRLERLPQNALGIVGIIDYAHTPDALEKLLLSIRRCKGGGERIVLLFGCGGDRDREKRHQMGRIASRLADFVIVTSDNPRSEHPAAIIRDILKGVDKEKPYTVIENRGEAIAYAVENSRAGDIILMAGKGHEEYEIAGKERRSFSERALFNAAVKRKIGRGTV